MEHARDHARRRVATVPTERCAAVPRSIAFINSLGNLGGFMGPYLMGWAHDTLGPRCADAREGAHPAAGGGSTAPCCGASGDGVGPWLPACWRAASSASLVRLAKWFGR